MRVSFTGTRQGMSEWQKQQLEKFFTEHRGEIFAFAHGACAGADVEAHAIAREVFGKELFIAIFPSTAKTRVRGLDANFEAEPEEPLKRDRKIVDAGYGVLLAAPLQMQEVLRSGTWSTIRYARKKKFRVEILWREEHGSDLA